MSILGAYLLPHPPVIIPEVGGGRERDAAATIEAMQTAATAISSLQPDVLVIVTPHNITYQDYIHISPGKGASGDFGKFGAGRITIEAKYDVEFVGALESIAQGYGIPAGTLGGDKAKDLDHGVMVPLYFIHQINKSATIVRISIAGLCYEDHYRFGQCIREAAEKTSKRVVVIASGDLSHKLAEDGPYGYAGEGPEFDKQLMEALAAGDFGALLRFDHEFCDKAAECGMRPVVMMVGAFDGCGVQTKVYSHEGPFGVGYGICSIVPTQPDQNRRFLESHDQWRLTAINDIRQAESPCVRIARNALESYVLSGKKPKLADMKWIPEELTTQQAGTFVSIKKNGQLRGCIGTIAPTRVSIAEEIMGNAISSGTADRRFESIRPDELPFLVYSVDILSQPEAICSKEQLDTQRYGVIVFNDTKRGLLLPNLDGIDDVEDQIRIALQKAGIKSSEKYDMERFEVIRHT